jgi:hypothetical protein
MRRFFGKVLGKKMTNFGADALVKIFMICKFFYLFVLRKMIASVLQPIYSGKIFGLIHAQNIHFPHTGSWIFENN